jgi:hypothetical protein
MCWSRLWSGHKVNSVIGFHVFLWIRPLTDGGDWWCLGQAVSHAGHIYYSGGASLAVNNVFKSGDTAPLHKYEYVSFPKVYNKNRRYLILHRKQFLIYGFLN